MGFGSIYEMNQKTDSLITELLDLLKEKSSLYRIANLDKTIKDRLINYRELIHTSFYNTDYEFIIILESTIERIKGITDQRDYINTINNLEATLSPFILRWKKESPANTYRNSEEFYEKEIENFKKEKLSLASQIKDLKEKLSHTEQEAAESEKLNTELLEKKVELNKYIELTKKYEAERREQEKINDSINVWKDKIIRTFETLKEYIKPIKKEHDRLSYLYWGYLGLSAILIICLAVIEYNICQKIISYDGIPTWEQYFSVVLPIPISLALLWGFIHEMNRSQRQLVILAKQIHEVEYVEGLLLTINMLSTDTNDSVKKINDAIDKLLDNHLTYRDKLLLDEKLLKKEEGKDEMPYEATMKILKAVNELVSNKK